MFIVALVAALVYSSVASAAIAPDYYNPNPDMFITNANQYYSVIYDGEGEALVSMRLDITNKDSTPLSSILMELPYSNVHLYSVAENIPSGYSQECISYVDGCLEYGSGNTCVNYDMNGNCISYETPCLKTGTICEQYKTTGSATTGYTKLDVVPTQLADSVSMPIEFSAPILQDQSRSVLIMYKVNDVAEKRAGVFRFEFDTARLPIMTKYVRVASNVQSGLILKGMKSNIDYRADFSVLESSFDKMSAGVADEMVYNSYAQSISSARGVTETASYLDPHESLIVEGKYANSWWAMYWDNVLLTIIIIAVVLILVLFSTRKLRAHVKKDKKSDKKIEHNSFTQPFLAGLYTTLAMLGLWVLTSLILIVGNNLLRHAGLWDVLGPVFVVISIIASVALIIGIPVHMSKKYGGSIGLYTLLSILGWIFLFSIIALIIVATFMHAPAYYTL